MGEKRVFEGKTTNEAIEKGLKELNVSKKDVEIRVIENDDKRSFFSILAPRVVKVELTLKENVKEEKAEKVEKTSNNNYKKESKVVEFDKDLVRTKDAPNKATLSVNGVWFNNRGGEPFSMVQKCMVLQDWIY